MQHRLAILTSLLIGIAACTQTAEPIARKENQLAISSVQDAPLFYNQGARFAIEPKFVSSKIVSPEQEQALYQEVTLYIEQSLAQQGYTFVSQDQVSDFTVKFALALASDVSDEKLSEHFGLTPGLPNNEALRKASLLIAVDDTLSQQRVWRGAAQGFAKEDIDQNNRAQRLKLVVNKVLAQFETAR